MSVNMFALQYSEHVPYSMILLYSDTKRYLITLVFDEPELSSCSQIESYWQQYLFLKRDSYGFKPPLRLMGFLSVKRNVFLWSFKLIQLGKVILSMKKLKLKSENAVAPSGATVDVVLPREAKTGVNQRQPATALALIGPLRGRAWPPRREAQWIGPGAVWRECDVCSNVFRQQITGV